MVPSPPFVNDDSPGILSRRGGERTPAIADELPSMDRQVRVEPARRTRAMPTVQPVTVSVTGISPLDGYLRIYCRL